MIQFLQIIEGIFKRIFNISVPTENLRYNICSLCDINIKGICSKELGGCGCFIKNKIKCKKCTCPLKKW